MEINLKKKSTWFFIVTILVIAVVAGIVTNMLVKQVQVDPISGDELPGGIATKGKLSLKGLKPTIK